jgi:hypothetical protein
LSWGQQVEKVFGVANRNSKFNRLLAVGSTILQKDSSIMYVSTAICGANTTIQTASASGWLVRVNSDAITLNGKPPSYYLNLSAAYSLDIRNPNNTNSFNIYNPRANRTKAQIIFTDSSGYPAWDVTQFGTTGLISGLAGSANYIWGKRNLDSLTTGTQNFTIGYLAMQGGKTASYNIYIGNNSAAASNQGKLQKAVTYNTAIGHDALAYLGYSGSVDTKNTAVGYMANYALQTGNNSTALGAHTIAGASGIAIGAYAIASGRSVAIGTEIHNQNTGTRDYNVFIGLSGGLWRGVKRWLRWII